VIISKTELAALLQAKHATPHSVLGMHPLTRNRSHGVVVRAFLSGATACEVVELDAKTAKPHAMKQVAPEGLFELFIAKRPEVFRYQLRATYANGESRQFFDPYSFLPTFGDQDLYLFNEGNEHRIYEKLGAHLRVLGGVSGVSFAVWAPSAARVSVVGNFNRWDGRYHPMRSLGASGVWELFVPGLGEGELYKFEIRDQRGGVRLKTDPYGTYFEPPPNNAAIVCDPKKFRGPTRRGWIDVAPMRANSTGRCRSTKCISARGNGSPRMPTVRSPIANSVRNSPTTRWRWASPTSK
jgi:1,4-alpha-glucan branching enzyme